MEANAKKKIGKITINAAVRNKQCKLAKECDIYQENDPNFNKEVK